VSRYFAKRLAGINFLSGKTIHILVLTIC
jgi:hypothetical protein